MKCRTGHRTLQVMKEGDRCSWVVCLDCGKEGPKKHSYTMAVLAWLVHLVNRHPREKVRSVRKRRR